MAGKRKSSLTYNQRFKRARMQMRTRAGYRKMLSRNLPARFGGKSNYAIVTRVNNLYRMIETKEATHKVESGLAVGDRIVLLHNAVYNVPIEPFRLAQGAADAMGEGLQANRIGDRISIKGLSIKGMVENAQNRPKTYYRILFLKCAKGDVPNRTTMFKNNCDNKMLDQINTERYTIIAQKVFNVSVTGQNPTTWNNLNVNGEPNDSNKGGIGTRTFSMWIPGKRICSGGNMQFENNAFQPKFFDYRLCVVTYDHVATAQDTNQVGQLNLLYTKCYFKDA